MEISKIRPLILLAMLSAFALTAAAQTAPKLVRRTTGQTLVSEETPSIRLRFDKKFAPAGSQNFILYDRARAEQHFFVDAVEKKIKRMFMVQFEGYLPGVRASYEYNEPRKVKIGDEEYFSNSETIPDVSLALKAVPDSDTAKAVKYLTDKGYTLPNSVLYQRFVRTLGPDKRNEIIILYVEEAAEGPTPKGDIADRALKLFKVVK